MSKTVVISITVPDGVTVDVQQGPASLAAPEPVWVNEPFTTPHDSTVIDRPAQEFAPFPARSNVAPDCRVHHVPMKPSSKVGIAWYCTQKIGPGPKDYCRESVKA